MTSEEKVYNANVFICTDEIRRMQFYQCLSSRQTSIFKYVLEEFPSSNEKLEHNYIVLELYSCKKPHEMIKRRLDFEFDEYGCLTSKISDETSENLCSSKARMCILYKVTLGEMEELTNKHPFNGKNWCEIDSSYSWCMETLNMMTGVDKLYVKESRAPSFCSIFISLIGVTIMLMWQYSIYPFSNE